MSIVLFRVDERLVHGQVVVGWGERLNMDRIVVVDDELCASPWEQELYCLGVPPAVDAAFVDTGEARQAIARWQQEPRRVVVLLRDVATLARVADDLPALNDVEINLGGIHAAPDRARVLPYLYLSRQERSELARLAAAGLRISARDLPGSRPVDVQELLGES